MKMMKLIIVSFRPQPVEESMMEKLFLLLIIIIVKKSFLAIIPLRGMDNKIILIKLILIDSKKKWLFHIIFLTGESERSERGNSNNVIDKNNFDFIDFIDNKNNAYLIKIWQHIFVKRKLSALLTMRKREKKRKRKRKKIEEKKYILRIYKEKKKKKEKEKDKKREKEILYIIIYYYI